MLLAVDNPFPYVATRAIVFLAGMLVWASTVAAVTPDEIDIPFVLAADVKVRVDGRLDESIWAKVPYQEDFVVSQPELNKPGAYGTRISFFYTERGFYVGMWNEQPTDTLLPRLSSRDGFLSRDGMQVTLDTSGEGLYGYWFSVNLGGSVGDGIVLPERQFRSDWDGAWYGQAVQTDDGWTAEMFIPWSILNMPRSEGSRRMGVYASRALGRLNERWSIPYLPRTGGRFLSALRQFELTNVRPRRQYTLFPFASSTFDNVRNTMGYRAGMDMFWRPSSYLTFSGTVTPDFGQVEADNVVVNLTAFETFFPEKRLFFLENRAIFVTSSRKTSDGTLLNTRRIGASISSRRGSPDAIDDVSFESFDAGRPVDLLGAVKATGQRGSLRYGFLAAAEDDTEVRVYGGPSPRVSVPGREFGVARLLYESTTGGGRQSFGWMGTVTDHPGRKAVTQGLDSHLLSGDGKLSMDAQLFFSDVADKRGFGALGEIDYVSSSGGQHEIEFDYFDHDLELNDLGFQQRTDRMSVRYRYDRREAGPVGLKERRTTVSVRETRNLNNQRIGGGMGMSRRWDFPDNTQASLDLSYNPVHWDDRNSFDNGDFKRPEAWRISAQWNSDWAAPWTMALSTSFAEDFDDGLRESYRGELIIRPTDRYSLGFRAEYENRDSWLVHSGDRRFTTYRAEEWRPRITLDTFFSARAQLRLHMEWVGIKARDDRNWEVPEGGGSLRQTQPPVDDARDGFAISRLSLQARYRWEIAPLSDLFLVYSRGGGLSSGSADDSFAGMFADTITDPDSEFLVVKLRYRLGTG